MNSVMFFLMYAESCGWDKENYVVSNNILDKWILIRLHQVTGDISKSRSLQHSSCCIVL